MCKRTNIKKAVVKLVEENPAFTYNEAKWIARVFCVPVKQVIRYINNYMFNTQIVRGTEYERGYAISIKDRYIFCDSFYNDKEGKSMLIKAGLYGLTVL